MTETPAPEAQQQPEPQQGIPAPPPLLILAMTTNVNGESSIQYNMHPLQAVAVLREMADVIEAEHNQKQQEQQVAEEQPSQ